MHAEARGFVERVVAIEGPFERVLEFGSRDINGSVRELFGEAAEYIGVDISPGPGVDLVCDAAEWTETGFDAVVCCEVLEHTPRGAEIIAAAGRALKPGGLLILTCATDPRAPHSATDGGPLTEGEHYANVDEKTLARWVLAAGAGAVETAVESVRGDLWCRVRI